MNIGIPIIKCESIKCFHNLYGQCQNHEVIKEYKESYCVLLDKCINEDLGQYEGDDDYDYFFDEFDYY